MDVGISRNDLHKEFNYKNLDETYTVMIDRTQSPGIQSTVSHCVFKLAQWSPPGASLNAGPVLAALTMDHQLVVFDIEKNAYSQIIDLSLDFCESMSKDNFSIVNSRLSQSKSVFEMLRQRSYAMAAVDVLWSEVQQDSSGEQFTLLFVSMKSGHIVLWKVRLPVLNHSCFELVQTVDTGDVMPVSMETTHVHNHLCHLFVSYIDGQIRSFSVSDHSGQFEIQESVALWEDSDDILVSHLAWQREGGILLAAKGSFLLAIMMEVRDTVLVVRGQTSVLLSDAMPVTALCCRNKQVYVSLSDGKLYRCSVNDESDKDQSIAIEEIKISRAFTHRWTTCGLALTQNSVYLLEAASPLGSYDHLVLRDPLKLNCVPLLGLEEVASVLLQKLKQDCPLCEMQDLVMYLRCHFSQSGSLPDSLSSLALCDIEESHKLTEYSTTSLKLKRYFLQVKCAKLTNSPKKEENTTPLTEAITLTEKLILHRHMNSQLKLLAEKSDRQPLMENDILSLRLMCKFLLKSDWCGEEHRLLVSELDTKYNLSTEAGIPEVLEKCRICCADISTTFVYGEGCPNGHMLGRCCQTLRICQDLPYRVCQNCESLTVSSSVTGSPWFESLKRPRCTYCDSVISISSNHRQQLKERRKTVFPVKPSFTPQVIVFAAKENQKWGGQRLQLDIGNIQKNAEKIL